ncbi:MAG: hypothetical protein JJU00_02455 [Opitutales bacterium]|nr:hypothetical protein [Opitutales bacterium]
MKKLFKILLAVVAAAIAVVLTIFLIFYFSAGLQKRLVLEELNSRPGVTAQADYIRFTFTGGEVRNLFIMAGADGLSLDEMTLRFSPLRLLRGEVAVREAEVRNLLVDLSEGGGRGFARAFDAEVRNVETPVPDPARRDTPDRFEGVLAMSREAAPKIAIGRVDITGTLLLPEQTEFALSVSLADWKPEGAGTLTAELAGRSRSAAAPVAEGSVALEAEVKQARRGGIEALSGTLRASARERGAEAAFAARGDFSVEPAPAGETYRLRLFRDGVEAALADLRAEWKRGPQRLAGELRLDIGEEAFAGIPAAAQVPTVVAAGKATFGYAPFSREGGLDLDLNASLKDLGRVGADLAAFEPLRIEALASIFYDPATVRVNELRTRFFQQGDVELVGAVALRPFQLSPREDDFGFGELSGELLRVRFSRVPLQILETFVRDTEIRGTTLAAEGVLSAADGAVRFRTEAPFGVEGMRVRGDGVDLVESLDVRIRPEVDWTREALAVNVRNIELRHNGGRVFTGSGNFGARDPMGAASGDFSLTGETDLTHLAGIPAVGLRGGVRTGLGRVEARGSFGDGLEATGLLHIRELRPAGHPGRPYVIRLEPEVSISGERIRLASPIRLTGPTSESAGSLRFDGTPPANGGYLRFDAALDLDTFVLDDWQPLLALVPEGPAPPPVTDEPDTEPLFERLDGTAVATVGRLRAGETDFRDLRAEVRITEGRRATVQARGTSGESPLVLNADLRFNAEQPRTPYTLTGDIDVKAFDVTPFLLPEDPRRPPMLEGSFDVAGDFRSTSPNLDLIADRLTGDFTLRASRPGVFRPLGERTGMADSATGIIGAITGSVRELRWIQIVADQLKEIPYQQMVFRVAREENLDIVLRELDLVSRETRIRGQGRIQHREGVDFLRMPMELPLRIHAKGALADALREGRQLRGTEPDDLGFLPGPELPIRGTLANPESLFVNLMMDSAQSILPGLFRPRQ